MRRAVQTVALVLSVVLVGWTSRPAAAQAPAGITGPRGSLTGPPSPTGTAVLRGLVVAADTGTPVRKALVRVMAPDSQDQRMAHTDDQGRFEIRELGGGRYTVIVSKTGFVSITYGQRRPNERGTPVELAPGATVENLSIGLPRGGVVTGQIVDETGEPLADAWVQVLRSQFMPGASRMLRMGRADTTDDQGAFRIYGLMPGDYVVSATARNEASFMVMGPANRPVASADADQGYAPTYRRW